MHRPSHCVLQGMLEGAGSIGQSVLRGFKGLISQPVQGAKRQGAVGEWGFVAPREDGQARVLQECACVLLLLLPLISSTHWGRSTWIASGLRARSIAILMTICRRRQRHWQGAAGCGSQPHERRAGRTQVWPQLCMSSCTCACMLGCGVPGLASPRSNCWPATRPSAPAALLSSALCSATAEGFDATFGKPKEQLLVMERRRPPRLVSGDGKLLPLVRGGSTKQVGAGGAGAQAVLPHGRRRGGAVSRSPLALLGTPGTLVARRAGMSDLA